jgi:NitT/TauT family transport system permease protein
MSTSGAVSAPPTAMSAPAEVERRPPRRAAILRFGVDLGYTAISLGAVIVLWYGVVAVFGIASFVLPYPHVVAKQIVEQRSLLFDQAVVTTREILVGFAVASVAGIAIGLLMAFSRPAQRLGYPALVVAQAVPKVALAPLFLAWFGFGATTNLAVTVLIAIFPVVVNTMVGLRAIDPDMVRLGRALGASRARLLWKIRLPIALPSIFAGLKLAMTFSAIGAVIGEFIAGSAGLGYLIQSAGGRLDTATAIAGIVVLSGIAVVLFKLVELAEVACLRGRRAQAVT